MGRSLGRMRSSKNFIMATLPPIAISMALRSSSSPCSRAKPVARSVALFFEPRLRPGFPFGNGRPRGGCPLSISWPFMVVVQRVGTILRNTVPNFAEARKDRRDHQPAHRPALAPTRSVQCVSSIGATTATVSHSQGREPPGRYPRRIFNECPRLVHISDVIRMRRGCLPDGDAVGPFKTEAEALADASVSTRAGLATALANADSVATPSSGVMAHRRRLLSLVRTNGRNDTIRGRTPQHQSSCRWRQGSHPARRYVAVGEAGKKMRATPHAGKPPPPCWQARATRLREVMIR